MLQGSARDGYFWRMVRFIPMFGLLSFSFLFFLGSIGCCNSVGWATQPSENVAQWGAWEAAKNLYDSQKFQDSLIALQGKPLDNANYYYNLGTSYYKLTQIGPAIAYLEKANRLRPHDSDTRYNLSIARAALGQTIGVDKLDPASNGLDQLAAQLSLDEVRVLLGFFGMLVLLVWLRTYLKTRSLRKVFMTPHLRARAGEGQSGASFAPMTPLAIAGLVGLLLISCIFGLEKWASTTPAAVSLHRHSVRSGPGERYSELAKLEAGTQLRILPTSSEASTDLSSTGQDTPGKTETWQQVRYSHDGIGWVKMSSLLVL